MRWYAIMCGKREDYYPQKRMEMKLTPFLSISMPSKPK
jgi:hypothetical protein